MNKLNVVFIGRLSFPNGTASTKRRRYIIDHLNEQNISCKVLCLRQKGADKFKNPYQGFYGQTEYINYSYLYFKGIAGKYKYFVEIVKKLKLSYKINANNILIFHANLPLETLPFFLIAREIGYKLVFDQVETSYAARGVNISLKSKVYAYLNNFITKWAYRRASGSFVISQALYNDNQSKYTMPLCMLPNSTPLLRASKKERFSAPIKILYVGTFTPKDGVSFLIKAFKKLLSHTKDIKLILIGEGIKKDMDIVFEHIKNNNYIQYEGYVSDEELKNLLVSSDILTVTRSNSIFANFGFPFKLSEYLATGNPIVATNVSDISLYLKDKVNACIAEPENVDSIYGCLKFLVDNEKSALEIGDNGIKVANEHFNISKNGQIFLNFLKKI